MWCILCHLVLHLVQDVVQHEKDITEPYFQLVSCWCSGPQKEMLIYCTCRQKEMRKTWFSAPDPAASQQTFSPTCPWPSGCKQVNFSFKISLPFFFAPIQLQSKANFQLQFLCRIQKQSSREIVVSLHFSICIRDDDDWSVISCFNPIFGEKLPKSKGWWTNCKFHLNFNLALAFEVPLPLLGGWKGLSSTKCET